MAGSKCGWGWYSVLQTARENMSQSDDGWAHLWHSEFSWYFYSYDRLQKTVRDHSLQQPTNGDKNAQHCKGTVIFFFFTTCNCRGSEGVLRKNKLESFYCGQIKDVCQSVTYTHMSGTRHKKTGYRRKCLNLAGKSTWNVIPLPQLTDLFVVSKKGTNISLFLNSRWY